MDAIDNLVAILTDLFKFDWLWQLLQDVGLWIMEQILVVLLMLLNWAISIMPSLGLAQNAVGMLSKPAHVVGYLNWIIPGDVVNFCFTLTMANLSVYYFGGWALRWLKIVK